MSLRYRADVDGLRAVAILPVVLFHYGAPGFSGGFVGVDVFFVISGFLITSLILSELDEGSFSILRFYERRIRRIFPALFLVVAAVVAAGYVLLFPRAFSDLGKTAIATSLFVSNFKFWDQSGYFDLAAGEQPLLHTWSLAVEEQFYLLFPPVLMAVSRWGKGRYACVILSLLLLSLATCVWATYATPVAPVTAFYLLPSRLWELMLGALLAAWRVPSLPPVLREAAGWTGFAMIAVAVFAFSGTTPFPGVAALLPCMGAFLVIWSGMQGGTAVATALSAAPAVAIGKISYSLYLWHWPVLVYWRYAAGRQPDMLESALLIGVSFGLAALSWRYVEQPFRRRRRALARRAPVFAGAGAAILAISAMGIGIAILKGLPERFDATTRALLAVEEEGNPIVCPGAAAMATVDDPPCVIGHAPDGAFSFLLWGDSHADAISTALAAAATAAGRMGLKAGHDACPPLLGVWDMVRSQCGDTQKRADDILAIIRTYDIKTVVLCARWATYALGLFVKLEENPKILLNDAESREVSFAEDERVFKRALKRTVETLRHEGRRVVLIGPWPEPGLRVPEMMARARLWGTSAEVGPTRAEFMERQAAVFEAFGQFAQDEGVEVLTTHDDLCAQDRCRVASDGQPLYWDDDHLSRLGAARLKPVFARIFR